MGTANRDETVRPIQPEPPASPPDIDELIFGSEDTQRHSER